MSKPSKLIGEVIVMLGLILLPTAVTVSQDFCVGNFDYDKDVDGTDASNFKSDFGRSSLSNPCPPDGPSPVAKTGRTGSAITGDDGDLERGLPWPMPRFTDNGNGTVTDNMTGLIWTKNANCFGVRNWESAVSDCQMLFSGYPYCGLNDGSNPGGWRLPNRFELESLLDLDYMCDGATHADFEVKYARTFDVGDLEPPCPPYEGLQRDDVDGVAVMLEVSEFYKLFGLKMSPAEGKRDVPDNLCAELEFLHFLTFKEAQARQEGDRDLLRGYLLAQKDFLERHLAKWVPAFGEKLRKQAEVPFYHELAAVTSTFITAELEAVQSMLLDFAAGQP